MLKIFNCLEGMRSRFKLHPVNFFLLLSVLWLWLIGLPGVVSAQVVDIPDANLRAAIAEVLDKAPGDPITRAEMETLFALQAGFRDITDLRGIEFAINLKLLYLDFNTISDISAVAGLTNLTDLYLGSNTISDISAVANLTNLTTLHLSFNNILDISAVANLTNLTELGLGFNNISDISAVASLTHLTGLDLESNNISDIPALASLTHLTGLWLRNNTISAISAVANLTKLTNLYLGSNTISDISAVAGLTNLTTLDLADNTISDISAVANLTNLTGLHLWDNNISDISAVASLTKLTYLSLGGNTISDISAVVNLTNLTHLHLHSNNISDIETLELLMARGIVVYFAGNPAFEPPGPKIEAGWVWLIVPATNVRSGSYAAASGRDFLSEASGGALTETDVAVNGANAGTQVGDSVWTPAALDATDSDNLNAIVRDYNLGTDIRYPVAYGVVPIQSETQQETRVYIGGGPVKVWFNGTLIYKDTDHRFTSNYETAVPVTLNTGDNLLFIAAYRSYPWRSWGAFFGFQDGTGYTVGAPGADNLDVNGDGQVNVIDLAMVALFYGTRVPTGISLPADVNADGSVNILDLTAVAQDIDAQGDTNGLSLEAVEAALLAAAALDGIAEAPAGFGNPSQHDLRRHTTYHNVAKALADARHLGHSVSAVLKELLHLLTEMQDIPDTTALLPNYPNPFNPETWIPYHLATDAEVILTIHDVRGISVRELTLGHQPAGVYESRARAAYWDGRNESGEPVASGVYFYTLTAGEFTATRKLLIIK